MPFEELETQTKANAPPPRTYQTGATTFSYDDLMRAQGIIGGPSFFG